MVRAALVITGVPRSLVAAERTTLSPSRHIDVTIVSPGNTTPEKRAWYRATLVTSPSSALSTAALHTIPNEQRPWRIGVSKPPRAAMLGSTCSGFLSPDRRYNNACCGSVGDSATTSG